MKPRALRIYKKLYGKDHESTPPKQERKPKDINVFVNELVESLKEASLSLADLKRAIANLERESLFESLRAVLAASRAEDLFGIDSYINDVRFLPVDTESNIHGRWSRRATNNPQAIAYNRESHRLVAADFSGLEQRIATHAGDFYIDLPEETDQRPERPRGPTRYANPDANIRGFRRGR